MRAYRLIVARYDGHTAKLIELTGWSGHPGDTRSVLVDGTTWELIGYGDRSTRVTLTEEDHAAVIAAGEAAAARRTAELDQPVGATVEARSAEDLAAADGDLDGDEEGEDAPTTTM